MKPAPKTPGFDWRCEWCNGPLTCLGTLLTNAARPKPFRMGKCAKCGCRVFGVERPKG